MSEITIHAQSVDFHIVRQCPQPSAVFVHGLGGDLHTWDSLWRVLGADFPALRYDLRRCGRSVCHKSVPFKHADDLLAILDEIGLERCDLIGVSMGGGIVLNFALDHPERVRNLVLISPQIVAWEFSEEWMARWNPIVNSARSGALDTAKLLFWAHPLFETTRNCPAGPDLYASIMRYSGDQWIHDDHELMLPDVERLHQLTTRTLLLTGGRDLDDMRLMADLIEASATNVRRIDEPARGHLLHLEDPEGCAERIRVFLANSNRC